MSGSDQRWTAAQLDAAKKRWLSGESASRIAVSMGKTTRAVVSKMKRIGITKNDRTLRAIRARNVRKVSLPQLPIVEPPPPPGSRQPLTLLKLRANSCRAIIGDVGPDGFALYCGDPQAEGSSWCPYHFGLYTQPPKEKEAV